MLILYSRPGCHLCEIAAERLEKAGIAFEHQSIAGNPDLEALYGIEIPVLTDASGRTLIKGVFSDARIAALLVQLEG